MTEYTHHPSGVLKSHVEFFYYSDGYTPPRGKERVLPSGSAQLIINLDNRRFCHYRTENSNALISSTAIIAGVNSQYIFLDPQTRLSTIGAVFKPGAIPSLFNIPADEFLDQAISLTDIVDSDIEGFRERLIEAKSPDHKVCLLQSFLLQQLNKTNQSNAAIMRATQLLKNQSAGSSVSDVAEIIGYSRRRFSTLFKQVAGIAPKGYARIQRLQGALQTIRSCSSPDWTDIALSCGYYDQAHFNRDFKALSGLTPAEYFRNQTDEKNHLPI